MKRSSLHTFATMALMTLALVLFQRGGALLPALAGALLFGGLALLRPDLGLLFVPITVPLYLMPAEISSLRADPAPPLRLPTYEIALLLVSTATAAHWLWRRISAAGSQEPRTKHREPNAAGSKFRITHHTSHNTQQVTRYAPHLLFLLTGILGVVVAVESGRALREFRWLIVEPLLFYTLFKMQVAGRRTESHPEDTRLRTTELKDWEELKELPTINQFPQFLQFLVRRTRNTQASSQSSIRIVTAFILGGVLVGLIGLLQFAGLDLVGLLGTKQCFAASGAPCDNIVVIGGVRRATSVYGHPNNLGLYLGRVWPLAAALAILEYRPLSQSKTGYLAGVNPKSKITLARFWFWAFGTLFCLGGIAVSFSRGAWLGAVAALAVGLMFVLVKAKGTFLPITYYLLPLLVLVVVAGLGLWLRGDVTAGSTPPRLLLWREAIGYIWHYPFGIGLDQFGYYHDPRSGSGRSLIDPALLGTSEQYASHPHNLLLDIWLRLGPLGLAAFGWLLARFFRRGLRMARDGGAPLALGALAAMVAALAHGLVDNFYFVPDLALAFWLLLALVES